MALSRNEFARVHSPLTSFFLEALQFLSPVLVIGGRAGKRIASDSWTACKSSTRSVPKISGGDYAQQNFLLVGRGVGSRTRARHKCSGTKLAKQPLRWGDQ